MQKRNYQNLQEEQTLEMQGYQQEIPVGQPVNAFNPPYHPNVPMQPQPYQVPPQNFMNMVPPPPPILINGPNPAG